MVAGLARGIDTVAHEAALSAFQYALQANDYLFACYIVGHVVWNRLALGDPLDDVHQDAVARMDFMRKTGFVGVVDTTLIVLRYVQTLRGQSPTFGTLDGEDFDEKALEAALSPAHMSSMVCQYWLSKMQARFMCGSYAEARAAGPRAPCGTRSRRRSPSRGRAGPRRGSRWRCRRAAGTPG